MKRLHPSSCPSNNIDIPIPPLSTTQYNVIQYHLTVIAELMEVEELSQQVVSTFVDASDLVQRVYKDLFDERRRELAQQQHKRIKHTSISPHRLEMTDEHTDLYKKEMLSLVERRDDDLRIIGQCHQHLTALVPRVPRLKPHQLARDPYAMGQRVAQYRVKVPSHFLAMMYNQSRCPSSDGLALLSSLSQVSTDLYLAVTREKGLWCALFYCSALYRTMACTWAVIADDEECRDTITRELQICEVQRLVILDHMAQRAASELCQFCAHNGLRSPFPDNQHPDFHVLQMPRLAQRMFLQKKSHLEAGYTALRDACMKARECLLSLTRSRFPHWLHEWARSFKTHG